jgi:hypothetical protein
MNKLKLTTICTAVLLLLSTSIYAQRKQQFTATGCEILIQEEGLKVIHTDTAQNATIIIDTVRKEISIIDDNSGAVVTWFKVLTRDVIDDGDSFPIITYKCLEKGVKTADIILPASTVLGKQSFFDLYIKTTLILTPVLYHFYLDVPLK